MIMFIERESSVKNPLKLASSQKRIFIASLHVDCLKISHLLNHPDRHHLLIINSMPKTPADSKKVQVTICAHYNFYYHSFCGDPNHVGVTSCSDRVNHL